jgi:hypothetical protein
MSIYIECEKETFLALVSVRQSNQDFVCQVRYVDSGLHYKLSPSSLVFDENGVLKQSGSLPDARSNPLMADTIKAISKQIAVG